MSMKTSQPEIKEPIADIQEQAEILGAWNPQHPGPVPFDNVDAANAVMNANFAQSVYVNTSATTGTTRQAYTYYFVQRPGHNWRICVVGHIHKNPQGQITPGNSFIPGWDNWQMQTPPAACKVIANLPDQGNFPGNNRYPQ